MTVDQIVIAIANAGLSVIFLPTIIYNIRRNICEIPLTTAVPRTGFTMLLCAGFFLAGQWPAGVVCFFDIACWFTLIGQRIAHNRRCHGRC